MMPCKNKRANSLFCYAMSQKQHLISSCINSSLQTLEKSSFPNWVMERFFKKIEWRKYVFLNTYCNSRQGFNILKATKNVKYGWKHKIRLLVPIYNYCSRQKWILALHDTMKFGYNSLFLRSVLSNTNAKEDIRKW